MGKTVTLNAVVRHKAETINANDVDVTEQRIMKIIKRKNFPAVA
jgi:hypothetical protein